MGKWQKPYSNRLERKINKQTKKRERTGKLSAAGLAALVLSSSWFCSPLCRLPYPTGSSLSWQDGGQYFTSEVTTHVLSLTLTGSFRPRSLLNNHYEEQERICWWAKARGICPFLEHKMNPIPCLWRESGRGAFSKEKLGNGIKIRKTNIRQAKPMALCFCKPPYLSILTLTSVGQFSNTKSNVWGKKAIIL